MHARRHTGFQSLLPSHGAQAPAVAGADAGESVLRHRRRKVVTLHLTERQKLGGCFDADQMQAEILGAGIAAPIAIEARQRRIAAGLKFGSGLRFFLLTY